ncbi:uncharacterized protein LOC118410264 [Branchiostoma floridae]|uniref:Uncharacterized protein LOC118410264 n=2 Tax=Branchiostoma floridae TaxID=7739 RepID=A0A9J7MI28_BRAFL|nr:uncharacterized protein LOC118410264 [Branchiostoma floridae]
MIDGQKIRHHGGPLPPRRRQELTVGNHCEVVIFTTMWNWRWKTWKWCWRTAGMMCFALSLTSQAKGTHQRRKICVEDGIKRPGILQTSGLGTELTYGREKNTVVFEVDIQRQKITRHKNRLVANLLTEVTETALRGVASDYRLLKLMRGNVSLAIVHPSPYFPYGTERGTTVIGYYATFSCSARLLPGSLLKQVVMNSRTRLEQAAGGYMIGDPVLFIRGPSNLQALDREYFLGLGALGLLALLLLFAGWQGTGDEVDRYDSSRQDCYC